ncbi:MAG: PorP/SprF family type IX secretion system membrane protein, partial [Bacteroidota bacterium]
MKHFLWFVLGVLLTFSLAGQQLEQYTQFSINPYLINPAVAGTEDFLPLKVGYRNQWAGFEGAPRTAYFSAHSALNNGQLMAAKRRRKAISRIGLGLNIINDRTGPIEQNSAMVTFAYNFALNNRGLRLSLALSPGFKQFSFDPTGYTDFLVDPDDPTITQAENSSLLQLAAGGWLYNDHFFLGGSSFQLLNSVISGTDDQTPSLTDTDFSRHYYFMGGLNIPLGDKVYFVPAVLIKTLPEAAISYD